jgi:hypothetical protein
MIVAMTDVLLAAMLVALFGLAYLFVKACERIIGPDVQMTIFERREQFAQGRSE